MGSFTDRKTLMRCIEHLDEKGVVDQHHRSSERGKVGMFRLQQIFLKSFLFFMTSWLSSDQRRTALLHKKIAIITW